MIDGKKVLISGAGGFIGGWLAETMFLKGSTTVKAGIRRWQRAVRLSRFPMEVVLFDVLAKDEIALALEGVSHVIHCASGDRDVIVNGTRNMLDMALNKGIKRFVHLSSAEVYGRAEGDINESSPFRSTGSEYCDSKIEAEVQCLEVAAQGLPITIVRPSIVYGPFSNDWTTLISQKLQSGNWRQFESTGDGYCNLIYISDLVSAIELAMRSNKAIGEAFNLNGPHVITWNEYFRKFNKALGLPELKVVRPNASRFRAGLFLPIRASAKLVLNLFEEPLRKIYETSREARSIMQFAEQTIKTTPTSEQLELFNRKARYSDEKARQLLDFCPKMEVDDGIRQSVRWLRHLQLT